MSAATAATPSLRVLLVLNSLGYLRFFDGLVDALLARGHTVHLLLERADHDSGEQAWLDRMSSTPGFSFAITTALRRDPWRSIAGDLRRSLDYVRFLEPRFRDAPYLVGRAERRAPAAMRRLIARCSRTPWTRTSLAWVLTRLDGAVPSSSVLESELRDADPDLVVVSPHLMPGARHSEYVKSARAIGVPTCLAIASWDNLSSKQLLHELPDRVVVWNDTQAEEAANLHGVPRETIVVTGAQSFDAWFAWPPRPREKFCRRIGVDAERPYLLYVGGSLFPGSPTEAEWALGWIDAIRRDQRLRDVGVVLRPHPNRGEEWRVVEFEPPNVTVWPSGDWQMPVDEDARADYFDSIYHSAAVVGLNTSAMIEAAIVGRTVHTMLVPEFASSQRGTFHFDYLLSVAGGAVRVASDWDEHREQLAQALEQHPDAGRERARPFVAAFVRPHGVERAAMPVVVDAIERTAALEAGSRRTPPSLHAFRLFLRGYRLWRRLRSRLPSATSLRERAG